LPIGRTDLSFTVAHTNSCLQLSQHFSGIPSDTVVMYLKGPQNSVRIDQEGSPQGDSLILKIDTESAAERASGIGK
jgi:hypothetical protein